MARWIVGDETRQLIIEASSGGPISLDVVPPGALTVGVAAAEDIRRKIAAAIGVARGRGAP
jgi:hypothetical protein